MKHSKLQITVKIIAHSIAPSGQHIVSWELEYPRFIHGEFMTHRLFSRNAASSRAIPTQTLIDAIRKGAASPIHWGANEPGMQANSELDDESMAYAMRLWDEAANDAAESALAMFLVGAHKQIVNRLLEPFQTMKTVMTATCLDNFFWLRNHKDAQPEIRELARLMWEALQASRPMKLKAGEWHVPYVFSFRDSEGKLRYGSEPQGDYPDGLWKFEEYTLQEALAISASCCAQVSYRKLDDGLEKAQMIYQRLVESEPVHASPFEHQATPMRNKPDFRNKGVTHKDRDGNFWSGNLVGWIQHRQLIPNNVCMKYEVK
jgi:thymidylate synthase ThyX